jgi:outer membrane protein assembly factor BamB
MGDLRCLDAATGEMKWARNLPAEYKTEPPVWGYAASLLIDRDMLYTLAGGEGSNVVALDKATGKEIWRALTTQDVCYSPPMIYEAGGQRQLIIWNAESINALDPATGKVFWSQPYPVGKGNGQPAVHIATIRKDGDLLFVTSAYYGPMMLKLASAKPAASLLWKGNSNKMEKPDGLHSLMAAPILKDGYVYGVGPNGELLCQDAQTGKKLWETYAVIGGKKADCGTAFIVPQDNRVLLFNDHGDLILAELSPEGYKEIDRARILEPVEAARGRHVVWSHPAFAHRCVFARNEKEMVCVSLAEKEQS